MSDGIEQHIALLSDEAKADVLRLFEIFDDGQDARRDLIDRVVKLGFVEKVGRNRWEFNLIGQAIARRLENPRATVSLQATAKDGSDD